jgi:hypothetical protein
MHQGTSCFANLWGYVGSTSADSNPACEYWHRVEVGLSPTFQWTTVPLTSGLTAEKVWSFETSVTSQHLQGASTQKQIQHQ